MNVKQTAQQIAQKAARKVARESIEVLKSAREQVAPTNETGAGQQSPQRQDESKENLERKSEADKAKGAQMMRAYEAELADIRREEIFKDLQKRISEGEDVPVENYSELSMEQKQVLIAQMEVVKEQNGARQESIPEVSSKKGRKTFGNIGVKRSQTQVEMRQPPSS